MAMEGQTPLTAADVAAITRNGYGNGCEWMWIFILFALCGFGGSGWGRNGAGLTQIELQEGFNNQSVLRKLDGLENGLCDGFYAMNTNNLQGQNQLQRDLCQGFAAVNAGIAENRYSAKDCCCETNRNIDAVRYENSRNTSDIVRAIEKDGEATRALINTNTMQALRDKIVEKDQMLQTAAFQISQQNQNAYLVNTLRPYPIPAYPTCSPYQAANYFNGCGYGCGCC